MATPFRVGEALRESWSRILQNPRAVASALAVPLVIELAVVWGFYSTYSDEALRSIAQSGQQPPSLSLHIIGIQVCMLLAYGLFAVSWARFLLLGEPPRVVPPVHGVHLRFIMTTIGVSVMIMLAVAVPAMVMMLAGMHSMIMVLLIVVAATALFVRVQLVFPAIAVERPIGLRGSWAATRGSTIQLFWAGFIAPLPAGIAVMILNQVAAGSHMRMAATGEVSLSAIFFSALSGAVSYIGLAALVGVVAVAYRVLIGWRNNGTAGA